MFKDFWIDDYEYHTSSRLYQIGRNILYYVMIAFVLFFNYGLASTPVNAYNDGVSSFEIENFIDYKDVETCNYSITAGTDGKVTDGVTMSCYTLNNAVNIGEAYDYVKTSNKVYETKYLSWVADEDLSTNEFVVYNKNVIGSNLLKIQDYEKEDGETIKVYSPTTTDYLQTTGQTWDYYNILKFIPSWVSENSTFYNLSSNGQVYYDAGQNANNGYDSYYKYDRVDDITYNKYYQLKNIDIKYIYTSGTNLYQYGDFSEKNLPQGYYEDLVQLTNVKQTYYKLQRYEPTYQTKDINGKTYGQSGFSSNAYYKDGIFYLWEAKENRFYAYEIDTKTALGYITDSETKAYMANGKTVLTKNSSNALYTEVKKYREYFEVTHNLTSEDKTESGTILQENLNTLVSSSTGNTYTYYDISKNPVSYDYSYKYTWTYVSDYLYEYQSDFVRQNYKYEIVNQSKTVDTTTYNTYQISTTPASEENTKTDSAKSGYTTLCDTITQLSEIGIKCHVRTATGKYHWVPATTPPTTYTYTKNTSSASFMKGTYSTSKNVYIGSTLTTIYKADSNSGTTEGNWFYNVGNVTVNYEHYKETFKKVAYSTTTTTGTFTANTNPATTSTLTKAPNGPNGESENSTGWNITASSLLNQSDQTKTIYKSSTASVKQHNYDTYYKHYFKYTDAPTTVYKWDYEAPAGYVNTADNKVDASRLNTTVGTKLYNKIISSKSNDTIKYDGTAVFNPIQVHIKVYNDLEGYTYWAAWLASFNNSFRGKTQSATKFNSQSKCDEVESCISKSGYNSGVWYEISSSEYNTTKVDLSTRAQQAIPKKSASKNWLGNYMYNHAAEFKWVTPDFSGISHKVKNILTQAGTANIGIGKQTFTQQLNPFVQVGYPTYNDVSIGSQTVQYNKSGTIGGTMTQQTNKSAYNSFSTTINITKKYYYGAYYEFTVKGTDSDYVDGKTSSSINYTSGSGTGRNGARYFYKATSYQVYKNTTYNATYTWHKYVVTSGTFQDYDTGNYRVKLDGSSSYSYFTSDGTKTTEREQGNVYSNGCSSASSAITTNSCEIIVRTSTYSSTGSKAYYKLITTTPHTLTGTEIGSAYSNAKSITDAVTYYKGLSGVHNATSSGTTITISFKDSTIPNLIVNGTQWINYKYYSSTAYNSSDTNYNRSYVSKDPGYSNGSSTFEYKTTRNNLNANYSTGAKDSYKDTTATTGTTTTKSTTYTTVSTNVSKGVGLISKKTVVTQTPYSRQRYYYRGLSASSDKISLFNTSSNPSLGSDYNFGYTSSNIYYFTGKLTNYQGTSKTLTKCIENSSTGECYLFTASSTKRKNEPLEQTLSYYTTTHNQSQTSVADNSKTSSNAAYYTNHIPTDPNTGKAGALCASSTSINCFRDGSGSPSIEVSKKDRYSYTKHLITYTASNSQGSTSIKYGSGTTNSNTNNYQEFGKLSGAVYTNDGSVTGGTYTKSSTSGGISSKNLFNQNDWFLNATTSGLVKSYNTSSKVFTYTGSGSITKSISGLTNGTKYYLSFSASGSGTLKVTVDGKVLGTFTLSSSYPSSRQNVSFTTTSTSASIVFTVSNTTNIKEISLSSSGTTYTQFVTHVQGNVTNTFYQTYKIQETYSYYFVTNSNDANGYALETQTNVIGYNNKIENANGWEDNLIQQNEKTAINANYVLYGKDFNKDGTIANNEKYTGASGALQTICLDADCHYRYYINSAKTPEKLNYSRTRVLSVEWLSSYEWFNVNSVLDINSSNITNINGQSDGLTTAADMTKYVRVNGKYYSITSNYGKYHLFKEYLSLNTALESPSDYKFNMTTQQVYKNMDKTNYFKYNTSHDANKLYNSVTKTYDKLDKGYTEVQVYNNENTLLTMVNTLINSGYSYLKSENVVYLFEDGNVKLTQERLFELYNENSRNVSYSCKDNTSEITLANCTFTYTANGSVEPLTKDDLVNNKVVASNKFGVIISNLDFEDENEYFRYNNFNYKFIKNENIPGYYEFDKFLFGGHWEEKEISSVLSAQNGSYAILNNIYTNDALSIYKFKDFDNYYTQDTKLYILKNNSGSTRSDNTYNNNSSNKYFYAWITGKFDDSEYSNYEFIKSYEIDEVYNSLISVKVGNYELSSHYLTVATGGDSFRISLKNMLGTVNSPISIYKLVHESDEVVINNILVTTDLEVLDLSQGIDTEAMTKSTVSYALKFSGMFNYWESTINGDTILKMSYSETEETQDGENTVAVDTCTLTSLKIQQKNSTITFGDEEISEFLLLNRGSKDTKTTGGVNLHNVYDLYALYQVKDGQKYYKVSDEIDNLLNALAILKRYNYTGYLFSALPQVNETAGIDETKVDTSISFAKAALKSLEENSVIEWSLLADNPELIATWFGGSTYANIIYTDDSMNPTTYDATTAFTSTYKTYYETYFMPLYSYLLYGHLNSNYRQNDSYPNINNLMTQVNFTEQIFNRRFDGTILNDDDSAYAMYVEEIVNYFNTLSENASRYDDSISQTSLVAGEKKEDGDWTKLKMEFSQAVGVVLDMYMHIDEYKYPITHVWEENEVAEKGKMISMIPAIRYSNTFTEANLISSYFSESDEEYYFSNFIDYVNNNGKSEFVFVRSASYTDRYYIYKLLESDNDSFSAISTIRQTSTTKNNVGTYRDYNNIISLDTDDKYSTLHKTIYDSVNKYINDADFSSWVGSVFGGEGFGNGNNNEGNALYYFIYSGLYDNYLNIAMINHLGSYIYSTESLNKYKPLIATFYSYIDQDEEPVFKYIKVEKSDIEAYAALEANKENAKNAMIDKLNHMATSKEKVDRGGWDYVLNTMLNNFNAKLYTYNNNGDLVSTGEVESYYFDVYKEYAEMPNGSRCEAEWCFGVSLPFDYEIVKDKVSFRSYYFYYPDLLLTSFLQTPWTLIKKYTDIRIDFAIKTSDVFGEDIYYNGHYDASNNFTDGNINESFLSEQKVQANITEQISTDTNYEIGKTNFNVSINDIDTTSDIYDTTSLYEYSLTYEPLTPLCYDGFEYNNISGLCHYISENEGSLKLTEEKYQHIYTIDYEYAICETYEDWFIYGCDTSEENLRSANDEEIIINSNKANLSNEEVIDFITNMYIYKRDYLCIEDIKKINTTLNSEIWNVTGSQFKYDVKISYKDYVTVKKCYQLSDGSGYYQTVCSPTSVLKLTTKYIEIYSDSQLDLAGIEEYIKNHYDYYYKDSFKVVSYTTDTSSSSSIYIEGMPAETEFTLKVRCRYVSGYLSSEYVHKFTTGDDMVKNPYDDTLKDINPLTLTSEQIASNLVNGDELLKSSQIPLNLQKCLFSYESGNAPKSTGVSICGEYVISNKYRLQLTKEETIRVAFQLVDSNGNSLLKDLAGHKLYFVKNIDSQIKDYHYENDSLYSIVSSGTANDLGVFYYTFNETDLKEYVKYSDIESFVNNYIFKNYTIGMDENLYSALRRKYKNETFNIVVTEYYDDRYTYLDYNQNGKMDTTTLNLNKVFLSKNGYQTYYENVDKEHYCGEYLKTSIDNVNAWNTASLFVNEKKYNNFKTGVYNKNETISYYIFAYDEENGAHIVK